jgi:hypothetical protein
MEWFYLQKWDWMGDEKRGIRVSVVFERVPVRSEGSISIGCILLSLLSLPDVLWEFQVQFMVSMNETDHFSMMV